ncbi:SDR family oxidoreductase [soil metagenome]
MTSPDWGLAGSNVLVIGGGQGIGESTALALAGLGCGVAVLDVELSRAETVAQQVRALGSTAVAVSADVLDEAQLRAAIGDAWNGLGSLDGMISIVGAAAWAPMIDMSTAIWDLDHQRNLRYFFIAAQEVARRLTSAGRSGSIVGVTSIDGIQSAPYHGAYGAAKAGLVNLVRTMAAEWAPIGLRVNAIAPGPIVTPRIPQGTPEEERARAGRTPAGRRGLPADVANAAVFLLSPLSAYVTGQTLAVDGGATAVGPIDYYSVAQEVGAAGTFGMG